jgi:hypothetical protein
MQQRVCMAWFMQKIILSRGIGIGPRKSTCGKDFQRKAAFRDHGQTGSNPKVRLADDSLGTARKRMATAARRGLKEFESMDYVYNPID